MGPMPAASPLPDPETIRRTAEQVLRRPDYQLDPQPDSGPTLLELLQRFFRWILTPFQWLLDALEGLPGWLRWPIAVGLAALLILLVLHLGYTIVRAVRGPRQKRGLAAALQRTPAIPPRSNARRPRRFLVATLSPPSGCCSWRACCGWSWRRSAPFALAPPTASTCAGTRIRRSSSPSSCSSR